MDKSKLLTSHKLDPEVYIPHPSQYKMPEPELKLISERVDFRKITPNLSGWPLFVAPLVLRLTYSARHATGRPRLTTATGSPVSGSMTWISILSQFAFFPEAKRALPNLKTDEPVCPDGQLQCGNGQFEQII